MECLFCFSKLGRKNSLENHYRMHCHERPHLCPKCPKELSSKKGLNGHLETHRPREEREMECHLCGKRFVDNKLFNLHIKYHDEKKQYKCLRCEKKFATKAHLNTHLITHASKRKRFQCDKCSKSFLTKSCHEEHRLIHQDQEYSFQCDKCKQRFFTSKKLKIHKRTIHLEKVRIFSCVFCGKQFPNFSTLEIHLTYHTFERSYLCKSCPAEFSRQTRLRSHEATHSKSRERFQCAMCPKSFLSKPCFNQHVNGHMGELHYKCKSPGCGMQFLSDHRRRNHYLKVHVGKQFSCTVCERKFLTKPLLKMHAIVHTNFKAYHCGHCGLSFKANSYLNKHKRTKHHGIFSLE